MARGKAGDAIFDDRFGFGATLPALGLDPLVGLKILVVLEEVLDLFLREFGYVV